MPRRSKIDLLPLDRREAIRAFINERGFGSYREMARAVEKQFGVKLSRSALARYGSKLEHRLDVLRHATSEARAIVTELGEEEGSAIGQAIIRLTQGHLFDALMNATEASLGTPDLKTLAKSVAEIERTRIAEQRRIEALENRLARAAKIVSPAPSTNGDQPPAPPAGLDPSAVSELRELLTGQR